MGSVDLGFGASAERCRRFGGGFDLFQRVYKLTFDLIWVLGAFDYTVLVICTMTIAFNFHAVARSGQGWSSALRRVSPRRTYSSAASTLNDTLPLAGIRVLDMTRVLAGVSSCVPNCTLVILFIADLICSYSHTVPKYWAI